VAQVRWTAQALADLEAIGDFIARDASSFAQVFVDRVFEAVKRLEAFPRSGRVVPEIDREDIREIIFGSYRIVYLVSKDEISILTVFHSARLLKPFDIATDSGEV
jgi:addiction module RelE/StbE family toxin